jgi:hypothetical protein
MADHAASKADRFLSGTLRGGKQQHEPSTTRTLLPLHPDQKRALAKGQSSLRAKVLNASCRMATRIFVLRN